MVERIIFERIPKVNDEFNLILNFQFHYVRAGVPQSSALSTIMYNLYTPDVPKGDTQSSVLRSLLEAKEEPPVSTQMGRRNGG